MAVSARTKMIVWTKAGGCCSFAECRRHLLADAGGGDSSVLGELAHIVAQRADGPRGRKSPPGGDVDGPGNVVLLCPTHHTEVDSNEGRFTVERLVQLKEDHERWVALTLSPNERYPQSTADPPMVLEQIHSTLLPVLGYPRDIFAATCGVSEPDVRGLMETPTRPAVMLPYIVRSRQLFTFFNLRSSDNPFVRAIDIGSVERHEASDWWSNDDLMRWYVDLLNRSLNKLTGRLGLMLDRDHRRYYFEPDNDQTREVQYRTLTGRKQSKKVAWRPVLRHSGEPRKYWEHLAVALRFHYVGRREWGLSIRPERRFTRDGLEPITAKGTGRRSTSRKSRMYNEGVLREVNFWRDFLSRGRPRIVFDFGDQSLMVSTELLRATIDWPGVKNDARPFTHLEYEEDLFTRVELDELEDAEEDTWEG